MNIIEQSKKLAAYNAVDHHVKPEHRVSIVLINLGVLVYNLLINQVIGVGSGTNNSTASIH
jgi:hypothetical protein